MICARWGTVQHQTRVLYFVALKFAGIPDHRILIDYAPDEGPSLEMSKFSLYFSSSCIPTNESLFIYYWHYLAALAQTVQDFFFMYLSIYHRSYEIDILQPKCTVHVSVSLYLQELVQYLLEHGADIDSTNNMNCTPFFPAVGAKQREVVEVILYDIFSFIFYV